MKRSIILKLLPLTENNLMAQILHQSYKMPVPAPIHTASGKLGLAPLSSALANKAVNKVSHIHPSVIMVTYISIQYRAGQGH